MAGVQNRPVDFYCTIDIRNPMYKDIHLDQVCQMKRLFELNHINSFGSLVAFTVRKCMRFVTFLGQHSGINNAG